MASERLVVLTQVASRFPLFLIQFSSVQAHDALHLGGVIGILTATYRSQKGGQIGGSFFRPI